MSENAELKAMLDYLNNYAGRRGKFYEDLHGIQYSEDLSGLGIAVSIPEAAIKQLYATHLRIDQLSRDYRAEENYRATWVQEHLAAPLLGKHLAAVKQGEKVDSEKEKV
ncbi:hypothetical protein LCGC14_1445570 [marine sediment metagenome]|uniref:Uncharacterized protein n=1 Tax=marine sediment metagenome TaxID=412755 RepID=A0A0F9JJC4_9ZZZZ